MVIAVETAIVIWALLIYYLCPQQNSNNNAGIYILKQFV